MRFIYRFYLWLLLLASGGLALLFGLTPCGTLGERIARMSFGLRGAMGQGVLTPGRYGVLRLGLGATALVAGALLGRGGRGGRGRWAPLARRCWAGLARPWRQLGRGARGAALALAVAISGARLYYAVACPLLLDELASYDYCVLPGPAATASFYPFPNNHVLPNLLVGLVHALLPGAPPALALRLLPTAAGLLALPVVYLLLLRYARPAVVTLGLGLFWLSPNPVLFAVAARGYAWTMLAAFAGLVATLELLRPPARQSSTHRLAWAVFGLSAVLGLYATPPHLYTVLALGLGLLLGIGQQGGGRRRTIRLAHLAATSLGVGAVVAVLYSPVGAVSGWAALVSNPYIRAWPWPAYRELIGPHLREMATELLGWRGASMLAWGTLAVAAPLVLRRARLPAPTRQLGWLLYLQLVLWVPLALAQRVAPPARTLLMGYAAFLLLGGLLGQILAPYWPGRRHWRTWLLPGLSVLIGLYGGYRLHRQWARSFSPLRQRQAGLRAAYVWLRAQRPRRIWSASENDVLIWHHYALLAGQRPLPLVVEQDAPRAQPGPVGELEVLTTPPARRRPGQPLLYHNQYFFILPVSPTQPRVFKP